LTNSDIHIRVGLSRDEENEAYLQTEKRLFDDAAKY
jgi:hypothetical protein